MPTPREGYFTNDGTRVPSVTTVLGNLGWNRDAIAWWANQEGLAGRNHRDTSRKAADAGTIAHAMVEADIHGREFDCNGHPPELVRIAEVAFGAYCEWRDNTRLVPVATEVKLVSERFRFGGTPDIIAVASRGLCLPDVKSARGTYADHVIQIAAYGQLWEEVTGLPLVGGYHILRFDKESGGFSHKWWPTEALAGAWRVFVRLRELHDEKKPLERLCK